jgi:hypothetical protein
MAVGGCVASLTISHTGSWSGVKMYAGARWSGEHSRKTTTVGYQKYVVVFCGR